MTINDIVGHIDDPEERASAASALLREIRRRSESARARQAAEQVRRADRPTIVRTEKRCPTCGLVRTAADFGSNLARPDGLQSVCRTCR